MSDSSNAIKAAERLPRASGNDLRVSSEQADEALIHQLRKRVAELERERDQLAMLGSAMLVGGTDWKARAEAAEKRLAALEAVLRPLANALDRAGRMVYGQSVASILRAALADEQARS